MAYAPAFCCLHACARRADRLAENAVAAYSPGTSRRMFMISQTRSTTGRWPALIRVLSIAAVLSMALSARITTHAANGSAVTPNYELASRWTLSKINKIVFDTGVTPHWFETGDRFWYSYETRDGKRYFLVD